MTSLDMLWHGHSHSPRMIPITDTHQHLIDPALGAYSWTAGIPQLAGRVFDYDEYLRAIDGTGITRTIFMETTPDAWRDEASHVDALSRRPGSLIAGLIANGHPEDEGFEEYLDSLPSDRLVGLRRICHVEPDDFSRRPLFRKNLSALARRGLTFDLCFLARQLPLAADLARAFPDTRFVLDHCGVPDISGGDIDSWRTAISEIAKLPNLSCKISGVLAYCEPGRATREAVRPFVEHCIESFGWDRVVWGSDWPVCTQTSTLREWVTITRDIVACASEAEQRRLFHENASRIYSLR